MTEDIKKEQFGAAGLITADIWHPLKSTVTMAEHKKKKISTAALFILRSQLLVNDFAFYRDQLLRVDGRRRFLLLDVRSGH